VSRILDPGSVKRTCWPHLLESPPSTLATLAVFWVEMLYTSPPNTAGIGTGNENVDRVGGVLKGILDEEAGSASGNRGMQVILSVIFITVFRQ
jgi:hypothetical protein